MKKNILNIILVVIIFYSCDRGEIDPGNNIYIEQLNSDLSTESAIAIVESNNEFAFSFFKKVANSDTVDNFMVSPLSLSMALGMVYNGSEGTTKDAFDVVLNYNQNIMEVNEFNKNLIDKLSSNVDGSVMEIANSIWAENSFPVKDEFIAINESYYNAEVSNLDFTNPHSVDVINDWVSNKTHEKIPEIIENIDPITVMFLINAIYFNATWKYEFDVKETKKSPFYKTPSEPVEVDMMMMDVDVDYAQNELFTSVILPYKHDKFSMVVLLPNKQKTTSDIVSQLNQQTWNSWLNTYRVTAVDVAIPKFKLKYENKLNDELIEMGLGVAFNERLANFSKISDEPTYISMVLQKTFIDVNEEGTEATAVTVVKMNLTTSAGGGRTSFFADRPFVYVIKENVTGSICFIGKVGKPTY